MVPLKGSIAKTHRGASFGGGRGASPGGGEGSEVGRSHLIQAEKAPELETMFSN